MAATTIAGLARAGGVGVETIRFYQRRGLLATPPKASDGTMGGIIRRYGEDDHRRLRFIRLAKAAGFTLDQIGELLCLDVAQDRSRARELAQRQLAVLDRRIAELDAARAALARLADQCSASEQGPCPIIAAFDGSDRSA